MVLRVVQKGRPRGLVSGWAAKSEKVCTGIGYRPATGLDGERDSMPSSGQTDSGAVV